MLKINIGCGMTPTKGWENYDNSWSIFLAKHNLVTKVLENLKILKKSQKEYIKYAKKSNISYSNAAKRIPEKDNSAGIIYSSHMLEHLDREEAISFLKEVYRVLQVDGFIRIVVPDLLLLVKKYLQNEDADSFIEETFLSRNKPKTLIEKIKYLIIGERYHQWLYDEASLIKLLTSLGFRNATVLKPGKTNIPNCGNLDLFERKDENSLYIEAIK